MHDWAILRSLIFFFVAFYSFKSCKATSKGRVLGGRTGPAVYKARTGAVPGNKRNYGRPSS